MKKTKQLEFKGTKGWGGRRRGAGRPRAGTQRSHVRREQIKLNTPIHITMRLKPLSVSLRSRRMFAAFKRAAVGARKYGLNINEFALLGNHLHFIAEARDTRSLSKSMRSFGGRLGKLVRAAAGGRGSVFDDRFHMHPLKTPTEYRRALTYVLLNRSKHAGTAPFVDSYSSAPHFSEWGRLLPEHHARRLAAASGKGRTAFLGTAQTWLGRRGWWRGSATA